MKLKLILPSVYLSLAKIALSQPTGDFTLPEIPVKSSLTDIWRNYSFFVGTTLSVIIIGFLIGIYYLRRKKSRSKSKKTK